MSSCSCQAAVGIHSPHASNKPQSNPKRATRIITPCSRSLGDKSRGRKSIHHHRGTPLFSVCRSTPRSQSKKKRLWCAPFSWKTREKGTHHRSGKKGIPFCDTISKGYCAIWGGISHWAAKQEGGFVTGWFWRMCPRSSFRCGGVCKCTLVPVFVPGEHPNVPSFRFRSGGTSAKPPFWKITLCQPLTRVKQSKSQAWCGPRGGEVLLRRVLRRHLARASVGTGVLWKAETRPFAEYDPLCEHPSPEVLGPLGASEFDPSFTNSGFRKPHPQTQDPEAP